MEMGQPPPVQADEPAMWVQGRQYTGRDEAGIGIASATFEIVGVPHSGLKTTVSSNGNGKQKTGVAEALFYS